MEAETQRNEDVDAYWRRRVVALGGVLATVGLVAWACSGSSSSGSGPRNGRTTTVRNAAALLVTPTPSASVSAAAGGSAAPGQPAPQATVTVTAQVTVRPSAPKRDGDACDPHDIVVGFTPTKDSFAKGEHPQFRLSVVNTGQQACTFGVGPKELQVQISSGSDKVWTSSQCASGSGSSIQMLQRGIPYGGTLDWDRHRVAPANNCSAHREEARPGTYTVFAKGGGIKTQRQVFRLH